MWYYMNRQTGELLTRKDMLAQWEEEYDGNDPTNLLSYQEVYEKVWVGRAKDGDKQEN